MQLVVSVSSSEESKTYKMANQKRLQLITLHLQLHGFLCLWMACHDFFYPLEAK